MFCASALILPWQNIKADDQDAVTGTAFMHMTWILNEDFKT